MSGSWVGQADPAVYERECKRLPGFAKSTNDPSGKRAEHENFNKLFGKWQIELRRVFIRSLESKDYLQIRNALIVMRRIIKVRPLPRFMPLLLP